MGRQVAVLLDDEHLSPGVEGHGVARAEAQVDYVADDAVGVKRELGCWCVRLDEANLLRSHGEQVGRAGDSRRRRPLQDVGRAHELGHERRARPLIEFSRAADLLDAAAVEYGNAVAHR